LRAHKMGQDGVSAEITAYAPRSKTQHNAEKNDKKPKLSETVARPGNTRIFVFRFAQRNPRCHQLKAARSVLQSARRVKLRK
jgi:hypothetical protein